MSSIHRTIYGKWVECTAPGCTVLFHVEDMSLDEAKAMPLTLLLPLFEVVQPPYEVNRYIKTWRKPINKRESLLHRDYDLPAMVWKNGDMEWYQNNRRHRYNGPAVINADGTVQYWEHGEQIR